MAYRVKEIYYTLQGEGAQAGRPAVFCRFTGCNLWSGREKDRASAKCWFCDTDFIGTDGPGGDTFETPAGLADAIASCWPKESSRNGSSHCRPYAVFTGGEPLLQLDVRLILSVKELGFETAVETNGTIPVPRELDWVTVSPKPNAPLVQLSGDELKLVFPQEVPPETVSALAFRYFYLSPLHSSSSEETAKNTNKAIAYCKEHPQWRLTMQYHKIWNIP